MDILKLEATTEDMAGVLGVHARSLQKLQRDGWIEGKIGHDRWNVAQTVQSYTKHILIEQRN